MNFWGYCTSSPMFSVSLDYCNYNSSGVVLYAGANWNVNGNYGLFYLNGNYTATNTNSNIGCRHLDWYSIPLIISLYRAVQ